MKILKFGGGVLKDYRSIKKTLEIVSSYNDQKIIIVVSSFGKTTNLFENFLNSNYQNEFYRKKYSVFSSLAFRELMYIAWKLNLINERDGSFFERIKEIINKAKPLFKNYNFDYDQIVSLGELISSKILSQYLLQSKIDNYWMDIRKCLITDCNYRDANVNWDLSKKKFKQHFPDKKIVVTQGFIGSCKKYTTTLGREGSDYSASIIANLLDASEVILFKDVEGVYEKDPKILKNQNPVPLKKISYDEIKKYSNPQRPLIHNKTTQPLKEKSIILKIRKFDNSNFNGTIIS